MPFSCEIFVWPPKVVSVSVRYLFHQPVDEKIKTRPLRFPAKENPNLEKTFIVLQYDVKSKYQLISRKFSDMNRTWAFDKPIKSLYFPSFVVFVLFTRFHFKVIWKSLLIINNCWFFFVRHWPVCFPLSFKMMIFFNNYWFFWKTKIKK